MPREVFAHLHQSANKPASPSLPIVNTARRSSEVAQSPGTTPAPTHLDITCTPAVSALNQAELRARWAELVERESGALALYAHPEWVASLEPQRQASTWLCTASDLTDSVVALLIVSIQTMELPFSVASRALLKPRLSVVTFPGGLPQGSVDASVLNRMIDYLMSTWTACDGLYISSVPVEDAGFATLQSCAQRNRRVYPYLPWGIRPWHRRRLDQTADSYFSALPKKQRSNIRRALRDMRKLSEPELLICRHPADVPRFLALAARVSEKSWHLRVLGIRIDDDDATRQRLQAQAAAGLLRSYVLCHDGEPLAYVIGHQNQTYYQLDQIGHDHNHGALSPGIVLLHKVIEDLLSTDTPTWLNFGIGDAAYKHRFGTQVDQDAAVLLLRRRLYLQLLTRGHYLFNKLIERLKRLLGRRVP